MTSEYYHIRELIEAHIAIWTAENKVDQTEIQHVVDRLYERYPIVDLHGLKSRYRLYRYTYQW